VAGIGVAVAVGGNPAASLIALFGFVFLAARLAGIGGQLTRTPICQAFGDRAPSQHRA
jgi:hypothetical protein